MATAQTFNYTGAVQTLQVPSRYAGIYVEAYGAQGQNMGGAGNSLYPGASGGKGGKACGVYMFKANDSKAINIYVGGQTGYNGGGAGYNSAANTYNCGGYGGGATDVRVSGTALTNRVITAGGGGGGYYYGAAPQLQGIGGGLTGGAATNTNDPQGVGLGGTQTAGGPNPTYGVYTLPAGFGVGGASTSTINGSGGGAGWYGGSAGRSGAGGGSSHIAYLTSNPKYPPSTTSGVRSGNGIIYITFIALDKFLIKKDGKYYSILPDYYDDVVSHNFIPLTLQGGLVPNDYDISTFGFSYTEDLTASMTKGGDTFKPIDKFKGGSIEVIYYAYQGALV